MVMLVVWREHCKDPFYKKFRCLGFHEAFLEAQLQSWLVCGFQFTAHVLFPNHSLDLFGIDLYVYYKIIWIIFSSAEEIELGIDFFAKWIVSIWLSWCKDIFSLIVVAIFISDGHQ